MHYVAITASAKERLCSYLGFCQQGYWKIYGRIFVKLFKGVGLGPTLLGFGGDVELTVGKTFSLYTLQSR